MGPHLVLIFLERSFLYHCNAFCPRVLKARFRFRTHCLMCLDMHGVPISQIYVLQNTEIWTPKIFFWDKYKTLCTTTIVWGWGGGALRPNPGHYKKVKVDQKQNRMQVYTKKLYFTWKYFQFLQGIIFFIFFKVSFVVQFVDSAI